MEVHDDPDNALSDRSTQLDIRTVPILLRSILELTAAARRNGG